MKLNHEGFKTQFATEHTEESRQKYKPYEDFKFEKFDFNNLNKVCCKQVSKNSEETWQLLASYIS